MKPRNIIEKIWDQHVVKTIAGHPSIFAVDLMLLHEVTSAQAFAVLEERGLPVFDPSRLLATIDHSIPTRENRSEIFDEAARTQVNTLRANCRKHNIPFFDFDSGNQGIVHVIGPELGATQPGMTIVCGDSHTSTHGAFGALAFGVGTSEVTHVMATGCLLQQKPKTMQVEFTGSFQKGVYAKDAIMKLIATIGIGGATGCIIEYAGAAVRRMSMEERMTICNMSIECGARAGLIGPDEITYSYLKGRKYAPTKTDWTESVERWQAINSDPDCTYDNHITIDLDKLTPMITWGINPEHALAISEEIPKVDALPTSQQTLAARALEYTKLSSGRSMIGTPVQWAYIGSCTNGRIEDLRIAAGVLAGHKVSQDVTLYIVPGSEAVRKQAVSEGLDTIFIQSGAHFRMPGCSPCLAMNDDRVPSGQRCISSSNRNFMGRQGEGSITHLASPATVAASAVEGKIVSPVAYL